MQLNNRNNHEIITIDKIDTANNRIFWSKYNFQNSEVADSGVLLPDENLQEKLNENINISEFCYMQLAAKYNDFEISGDIQNWKVLDRPIRLFLPEKLVIDSLIAKDDLSEIIQRVIDDNLASSQTFLFNGIEKRIAYFLQIAADDATIVTPYIQNGSIIMQTKLM